MLKLLPGLHHLLLFPALLLLLLQLLQVPIMLLLLPIVHILLATCADTAAKPAAICRRAVQRACACLAADGLQVLLQRLVNSLPCQIRLHGYISRSDALDNAGPKQKVRCIIYAPTCSIDRPEERHKAVECRQAPCKVTGYFQHTARQEGCSRGGHLCSVT